MPAPKDVSKEKYDRCVEQVKKEGDAKNAYAVCAASLKEGKSMKKGMSVKEAIDKILHDKWEVQDVLPKVDKEKRDDVLDKLRSMDKKDVKIPHGHDKDKGKKAMKKSKEELTKEYTEAIMKGEMTLEDVKKAISSESGPMPETDNTPQEETQESAAEASSEESVESEESKPEVKFADDLFNEFYVGSTLNHTPNGSQVANARPHKTYQVKTVEKK